MTSYIKLAWLAGCSPPDSKTSAGAGYLLSLAGAVEEMRSDLDLYDDNLSDVVVEIVDSCIPIYDYELWSSFVDLGGWEVDYDPGLVSLEWPSTLATAALLTIGETLVYAILQEGEKK